MQLSDSQQRNWIADQQLRMKPGNELELISGILLSTTSNWLLILLLDVIIDTFYFEVEDYF